MKEQDNKNTSNQQVNNKNDFVIILYYKYANIDNPEMIMERERAVCNVLGLKGRIIVANEGINGTLEGDRESIEKYKSHILADKKFKGMNIKESLGTGDAFPRLMVKVKDEIVSTKLPKNINPNRETGKYLQPHDLKKMYDDNEDFVIVDMRNDYELASGYFDKTIDLQLENSRDLQNPEILEKIRVHKDKKLVTVCTGGVRCEKMSAYLLDQGFEKVYQLHNGMHNFMEKYPGEHFKGALYTFDNRKVMHFGGNREIVGKCFSCNSKTERYENCANPICHKHFLVCEDCVNLYDNQDFYCKEECKNICADREGDTKNNTRDNPEVAMTN
ncbi:MAG: rhodanese-related sulfurtransferase [Cyanobium sp. MAG06]|nr:rhodanese-related sulfurtransferase [Cyanobium sp. MAG06]